MNAEPAEADLLDQLRGDHPRLLVSAQDFEAMRDRRATDVVLDAQLDVLESRAEALLAEPVLKRKKVGRRMLGTSRNALSRITTLALAYHTAEDERFAQRALAEMNSVVAFSSWNPAHYLDVAEMATAVALGYDWLYHTMTPEERATIREGLIRHALTVPREEWGTDWRTKENNWNSVCYGGMVIAALAIAEDEPDVARAWLDSVRTHNVNTLVEYAPDGVYPEGPGYWAYGTTFQVLMVDALRSAIDNDLGLAATTGFVPSGGFMAHVQGPTGRVHNFADCRDTFDFRPVSLWIAHEADRSDWLKYWSQDDWSRAIQGDTRFQAFAPIWWSRMAPSSLDATGTSEASLSWQGQGKNPVAYFRDRWDDPRAMWLGVKGGRANLSHGHMDAGSFVFEADGVRWAIEMGGAKYHALESAGLKIWNRSQKSDRWKILQYRNEAHNTITVADQPFRVDQTARLTGFTPLGNAGDAPGHAVVDMAEVLGDPVESAEREATFFAGADRRVVIHDTLRLPAGTPLAWTMMTEAKVEPGPLPRALTLTQDGESLVLEVPDQTIGRWVVEPYEIYEGVYGAERPEVTRLRWQTEADAAGRVDLRVVLRPQAEQ